MHGARGPLHGGARKEQTNKDGYWPWRTADCMDAVDFSRGKVRSGRCCRRECLSSFTSVSGARFTAPAVATRMSPVGLEGPLPDEDRGAALDRRDRSIDMPCPETNHDGTFACNLIVHSTASPSSCCLQPDVEKTTRGVRRLAIFRERRIAVARGFSLTTLVVENARKKIEISGLSSTIRMSFAICVRLSGQPTDDAPTFVFHRRRRPQARRLAAVFLFWGAGSFA